MSILLINAIPQSQVAGGSHVTLQSDIHYSSSLKFHFVDCIPCAVSDLLIYGFIGLRLIHLWRHIYKYLTGSNIHSSLSLLSTRWTEEYLLVLWGTRRIPSCVCFYFLHLANRLGSRAHILTGGSSGWILWTQDTHLMNEIIYCCVSRRNASGCVRGLKPIGLSLLDPPPLKMDGKCCCTPSLSLSLFLSLMILSAIMLIYFPKGSKREWFCFKFFLLWHVLPCKYTMTHKHMHAHIHTVLNAMLSLLFKKKLCDSCTRHLVP